MVEPEDDEQQQAEQDRDRAQQTEMRTHAPQSHETAQPQQDDALPARFQMLSALQAVNGVLLFGISTAFLFAVIQVQWKLLSHRHETVIDRAEKH
jgi:hypothetical protein